MLVVLTVDRERVLATGRIETSFALLLGSFFIFNVQYPKKASLLLEFLPK